MEEDGSQVQRWNSYAFQHTNRRKGVAFSSSSYSRAIRWRRKYFLFLETLVFSCSESLLLLAGNTTSFKIFSFLGLTNIWLLALPSKEKHFILPVIHNPSPFSPPALRSILILHCSTWESHLDFWRTNKNRLWQCFGKWHSNGLYAVTHASYKGF